MDELKQDVVPDLISTGATRGPGRGKFEFPVATNPAGRRVFYFPYMTLSDIHWGTQYSRAKLLCHMMQNTLCAKTDYIGDIYDGTAVLSKPTWNLGPYHRQGIAHGLRKAAQGTTTRVFRGNHEDGISKEDENPNHRNLDGKNIFGVEFVNSADHVDVQGRKFLCVHGDEFDDHLFETAWRKAFWYKLGDSAYKSLYFMDRGVRQIPILEHFSLAALGKKAAKIAINNFMGVRNAMAREIDEGKYAEYDGAIYGHSHMPGFQWTPGGKLLINDGCCTEHVNALVEDANGTKAILTWHKAYIEVEEEPVPGQKHGPKYKLTFAELGFHEALEPVEEIEDEHTENADRLIRLIYMMWPPQDRAREIETLQLTEKFVKVCRAMQDQGGIPSILQEEYHRAIWRLNDLKGKPRPIPVSKPPGPARAEPTPALDEAA